MLGFYAYQIQRATSVVVVAGTEKVYLTQARWNAYSQIQLAKLDATLDTVRTVSAMGISGTDTVQMIAVLTKDVHWKIQKMWESQ
jgi:hypothetical protein